MAYNTGTEYALEQYLSQEGFGRNFKDVRFRADTQVGFFGVAPASQPAHADQAAVTATTDIDGSDSVDKEDVLAAIQAVETLVNRLRADLVTLGLIKGSA